MPRDYFLVSYVDVMSTICSMLTFEKNKDLRRCSSALNRKVGQSLLPKTFYLRVSDGCSMPKIGSKETQGGIYELIKFGNSFLVDEHGDPDWTKMIPTGRVRYGTFCERPGTISLLTPGLKVMKHTLSFEDGVARSTAFKVKCMCSDTRSHVKSIMLTNAKHLFIDIFVASQDDFLRVADLATANESLETLKFSVKTFVMPRQLFFSVLKQALARNNRIKRIWVSDLRTDYYQSKDLYPDQDEVPTFTNVKLFGSTCVTNIPSRQSLHRIFPSVPYTIPLRVLVDTPFDELKSINIREIVCGRVSLARQQEVDTDRLYEAFRVLMYSLQRVIVDATALSSVSEVGTFIQSLFCGRHMTRSGRVTAKIREEWELLDSDVLARREGRPLVIKILHPNYSIDDFKTMPPFQFIYERGWILIEPF